MSLLRRRNGQPALEERLVREGLHPVLARLYAARGVIARREVEDDLKELLPPVSLHGTEHAACLLADAIERRERLLIVADYDCDGATACAVGLRALRAFGAEVDFIVPDRFRYGYGLTPEIVRLAAERRPRYLITVDNGIASVEGVDEARALGIDVIVTDHHLPGPTLPAAAAIVNPNQPSCGFESKCIAGVGVMFYVMLALRAELRKRGAFKEKREPALGDLLDLVALGTVADVVRLDRNNRVLVSQGLRRIRAGRMQPGLRALFAVGNRDAARAGTFDLGFVIGPRLNAAGRLEDMSVGIECLATDDYATALNFARRLDDLNRERRGIEAGMQEQAEALLAGLDAADRMALSLFEPTWHQGVIGIVAGRIKERLHRPVIAFARGNEGEIKGSGRSVRGLHLRDALDLVEKRAPGLLLRFGGHAAAAGVTLRETDFEKFSALFEQVVRELVPADALGRTVETDGPLEIPYMSLDTARLLEGQVWGQGFPQPVFCDDFAVMNQRLVGEKHMKLRLSRGGRLVEALQFNAAEPLPSAVRAAYRLSVNEYQGVQSLQLVIEHWEGGTTGGAKP
jgi:single-stranded-DNA-specific exonuclease